MTPSDEDRSDPELDELLRYHSAIIRRYTPDWLDTHARQCVEQAARWRRRRHRLRTLAMCAGCVVLGLTVAFFVSVRSSLPPPMFPGDVDPAAGRLHPGETLNAGDYVVSWSLPADKGGVITVLEVLADGSVEVRPKRDRVCQKVAVPRKSGTIQLELLFGSAPGPTVVWLILSDKPGAEALIETVRSSALVGDLRGRDIPEGVLTVLRKHGIDVVGIGRVIVPAAKTGKASRRE